MFQVVPVVAPTLLRDVPNGFIPLDKLQPVPGGSMLIPAARAWTALVAAAKADGIDLRPTSGGDTYRPYSAQEALFRSRYVEGMIPGREQKRWNGVVWSKKSGVASAAVPGSSNHGWGLAIDVAYGLLNQKPGALDPSPGPSTTGRDAYRWLVAHYRDYGFSHEYTNPATEPWHIRFTEGDAIPPALVPPPYVPPPSPLRSVTMLLLDLFRNTDNWTAFQCDGKTIWWASNGNTVDVLQRGGVPRVDVGEAELIGMLLDVKAQGKCPVPNPSPELAAAWYHSAIGQ